MKNSYLTAGITLSRLFKLLFRNKVTLTPQTFGRLLFLIQSSLWSSVFAVFEKIVYHRQIQKMKAPEDPVFIVGHWRTGSTFLHQLMNLDPGLMTPTLFQVAVPDGFLTSYPYYKPLLKHVISKKRPMDNVKLGMDEPQEDEYAIYRITDCSPLERLVFPKTPTYFLLDCDKYLPAKTESEEWKNNVVYFFKKLSFKSGKTIVSKNPFNSMRIPLLAAMFPKAKFIHIVRHPYHVIPSTIHMWDIVQRQNCLNKNTHCPTIDEVVTVFDSMLNILEKDFQALSPDRHLLIRYEDLENQPVRILEDVYKKFGMPFSSAFRNNINRFLEDTKEYEKNSFPIQPGSREIIRQRMQHHMRHFGYD